MNDPFIFKVLTLYFTGAVSIETDELETACFVVCRDSAVDEVRLHVCYCLSTLVN